MWNVWCTAYRLPISTMRVSCLELGVLRTRTKRDLIAVRCSQCASFPYLLEEGQPSRIDLIGHDDVTVLTDCNSEYNYYPLGIGHILEAFISDPSDERLEQMKNDPIEIGFLVKESVNLIVVAYRRGDKLFNVTPYSWLAQREWFRAVKPPLELTSETDRSFTVAYTDIKGGKYRVIRGGKMSPEFAVQFHSAIHEHIERGAPDWDTYRLYVQNLGDLLYENKVESLLVARCWIVPQE